MGTAPDSFLAARILRLFGPRRLLWEEEPLPTAPPPDALLYKTLAIAISSDTDRAV